MNFDSALILAGGYGSRLHPWTREMPKPMLPIGNRPLLEILISRLRQSGISRVLLATHFKKELIAAHFGDGQNFGVRIEYLEEPEPLGTAGALGNISDQKDSLLVVNGDILTTIDFQDLFEFHRRESADGTVAVWRHEIELPYGVVRAEGNRITEVVEKPRQSYWINAGIYLLRPGLLQNLPRQQRLEMPDLVSRWTGERRKLVLYPFAHYWKDIGRPEDYLAAQQEARRWGLLT